MTMDESLDIVSMYNRTKWKAELSHKPWKNMVHLVPRFIYLRKKVILYSYWKNTRGRESMMKMARTR